MAGSNIGGRRYAGAMDFIIANWGAVLASTLRHLDLCARAVTLAIAVGVPLGLLAARVKVAAGPVLAVVSLIYTIPTLAMFGLMLPLLGLGLVPAVVAIALYSLLPLVQNVYTGFSTVRPEMLEVARGLGMRPFQRLIRVELPMALPLIFAGLRVCLVNAIGMGTLASLVGAGGLGDFVFRGIATVSLWVVAAGAVPVILLALLADAMARAGENACLHWLGEEQA